MLSIQERALNGLPSSPGQLAAAVAACRERTAQAAAFTGDRVLRQYQTDILRQISTGGNYLVVAQTGAGKVIHMIRSFGTSLISHIAACMALQTEIIPHHAATLLERNHNAKTVVLAPTINLADQQAGEK